MKFPLYFATKIIPALRKVFGEENVQASSISSVPGISGVILRPGNECNVIFRIYENELGLILNLSVNRTDTMKDSIYIEDPSLILDHIFAYAKEWGNIEQFGRIGLRAEQVERETGTLVGVDPSEYNGLSDISDQTEPEFDEFDELKIREIA